MASEQKSFEVAGRIEGVVTDRVRLPKPISVLAVRVPTAQIHDGHLAIDVPEGIDAGELFSRARVRLIIELPEET